MVVWCSICISFCLVKNDHKKGNVFKKSAELTPAALVLQTV